MFIMHLLHIMHFLHLLHLLHFLHIMHLVHLMHIMHRLHLMHLLHIMLLPHLMHLMHFMQVFPNRIYIADRNKQQLIYHPFLDLHPWKAMDMAMEINCCVFLILYTLASKSLVGNLQRRSRGSVLTRRSTNIMHCMSFIDTQVKC